MAKYLSLSERIRIEKLLESTRSFKAIGRELDRDCNTIRNEITRHTIRQQTGCFGHAFNDCANRFSCDIRCLCGNCTDRHAFCRFCGRCHLHCRDYFKLECSLLNHPPYVCNGCSKRSKCTLEKRVYSAQAAQAAHVSLLSGIRSGICLSEKEARALDDLISPLIINGQSIHHICTTQRDRVMFSEKTIYNYVNAGLFRARNIDLPRKVRYSPRRSRHDSFKVDRACRCGRSLTDFGVFLTSSPDTPVTEMDSVEGRRGGKVILTIHFVKPEFMLGFLRDRNTASSVAQVFDGLYRKLGPDVFMKLFPVLLGDNGSEFSDPISIEMDPENNRRTRVFYCDPGAPYQKGAAENNHEFIRRVLPKGCSFDTLAQEDIDLMMNHINSYNRENLGNRSPYEAFCFLYGRETAEALGAVPIPAKDIVLRPELLRKNK
ncbi:MAG: IS30 family transposase [Lachnospiraceae bacterium]|jgi:transposase, IS30 family|nr:IS30 family transposase [Lachnospiraceae bacterium]